MAEEEEKEPKGYLHYTPAGFVREAAESVKGSIFDSGEANALLEEVRERLSKGSINLMSREVTIASLLTAIVQSLAWDYGASITGLHNDQWSAVTAATNDGKLSTWVECYDLLAGVALTWKLIAENVEVEAR